MTSNGKSSTILFIIKIERSVMEMKTVILKVPDYVFAFYAEVGKKANGIPAEKVMSDALFKLAGELSLNAIDKQNRMAE